VRIDIPRILLHLRWKESLGDGAPAVTFPRAVQRARRGMARFARLARHPRTMRLLSRIAGIMLRPFARDGWMRRMPGPFKAWTRTRDFPAPGSRR